MSSFSSNSCIHNRDVSSRASATLLACCDAESAPDVCLEAARRIRKSLARCLVFEACSAVREPFKAGGTKAIDTRTLLGRQTPLGTAVPNQSLTQCVGFAHG